VRQIIVRRFKSKAERTIAAAVVGEAESGEQLEAPNMVVVLARRDLVWLQSFFAALDHGRVMDYSRMRTAVTSNLDALTDANGSCTPALPQDSKSSV
jgi:hypothetical protein